jgi:hypothetical protein
LKVSETFPQRLADGEYLRDVLLFLLAGREERDFPLNINNKLLIPYLPGESFFPGERLRAYRRGSVGERL